MVRSITLTLLRKILCHDSFYQIFHMGPSNTSDDNHPPHINSCSTLIPNYNHPSSPPLYSSNPLLPHINHEALSARPSPRLERRQYGQRVCATYNVVGNISRRLQLHSTESRQYDGGVGRGHCGASHPSQSTAHCDFHGSK